MKGCAVIGVDNSPTNPAAIAADRCGEWSVEGGGSHVVVIDHHDSFTYNLVQSLSRSGARVSVRLADRLSLEQLRQLNPDRLVLSPGPGAPEGATMAARAIEHYRGRIPILGVCLGHQVIARQLGASVEATGSPVHGKPEQVFHHGLGIFAALPSPFPAARYHSLAVVRETLPEQVEVVAWTSEGLVMGIGVIGEATWGVQFHPESFLTPQGNLMLELFNSGVRCQPQGTGTEPVVGQERSESGTC